MQMQPTNFDKRLEFIWRLSQHLQADELGNAERKALANAIEHLSASNGPKVYQRHETDQDRYAQAALSLAPAVAQAMNFGASPYDALGDELCEASREGGLVTKAVAAAMPDLKAGRPIAALKEYRNVMGCSLLDAKNAIQDLRRQYNL